MDITLPYRIFAVDPAMGKSGWAVLDVISLHPLKINIVKTGVIDGEKIFRAQKEMAQIFQRQFCIANALHYLYKELLTEFKPDVVVNESAFGFSHMSALISLTIAIHELRRAAHAILDKDLTSIPPTMTKLAFTGKGGADKDLMRWAYRTHEYLFGKVPEEEISEHEIDAIGHAVGFIKRDLTKEVIQISAKEKKRQKREKAKQKAQVMQ